jgi:short-subunit dehydrogenase
MVDLNCRSVMEQAYRFGQRFKGRPRSGIILLSSIVAFQGMPYSANYAATKAYVQSLAEGLAHELSPQSIDVLSVAPGPTESAFAERAGMKMGKTASASSVASASLRALGRRTSILPGFLAKLLGGPIAWLPRGNRVWLMGRIGKGMVEHG